MTTSDFGNGGPSIHRLLIRAKRDGRPKRLPAFFLVASKRARRLAAKRAAGDAPKRELAASEVISHSEQ